MARTILKEAIRFAAISVLVPLFFILLLTLVGSLLGYGQDVILLIWTLIVPSFFIVYYYRVIRKLDFSQLKVNKKRDWEQVGLVLGLLFTIVATLLSLQAFYGQTVTQSRCSDPSNANVTSPNCKVIETVSVPQSGILGDFSRLFLTVVLLALGVFGLWTITLYVIKKAELNGIQERER